MNSSDPATIREVMEKAAPIIREIEAKRGTRMVVLFCYAALDTVTVYKLNKILRRMGPIENLDILIESGGGDIDAAVKLIKTAKAYAKKDSAVVPFYAKSAASLIALSADDIVMCKAGELGPIDPQVRDPLTKQWIPAHSITEALRFIEECHDVNVKLSLADKLPVMTIGAYRDSQQASEQYLEEAFAWMGDKKAKAIETFAEKFLSHGYPIDRNQCMDVGLKVVTPDSELEGKLCDLHELYTDMALSVANRPDDGEADILLIQGDGQRCVVFGVEDISSQIFTPPAAASTEALQKIIKP